MMPLCGKIMKSILLFLEQNPVIKPPNLQASIVNSNYRHVGNKRVSQVSNDVKSVNINSDSVNKLTPKPKPTSLGGRTVFTTP